LEEGKVVDVFTNPKEKTTREFVGSIISHKLPEEAWRHLNVQKEWSDNLHPIIRLTFTGNVTDEPIVAGMIRRFGIDVSILFGGVDYIQEVSFGHLIIVLDGDRGSEEQAIEYLKGLPIGSEVIGYVAANS
ncbi:MAG: methionine ABC transporter ATP-binding protein, partial [Veillonella sp.]|nr:methionine ABC transporter ATP-binding protein [Veillonella sp.]